MKNHVKITLWHHVEELDSCPHKKKSFLYKNMNTLAYAIQKLVRTRIRMKMNRVRVRKAVYSCIAKKLHLLIISWFESVKKTIRKFTTRNLPKVNKLKSRTKTFYTDNKNKKHLNIKQMVRDDCLVIPSIKFQRVMERYIKKHCKPTVKIATTVFLHAQTIAENQLLSYADQLVRIVKSRNKNTINVFHAGLLC